MDNPLLPQGLSLLIYIGAVLSILYYFGVTQLVASKLAWAMSAVMGTTAIETLAVAANIMLNGVSSSNMLVFRVQYFTCWNFLEMIRKKL